MTLWRVSNHATLDGWGGLKASGRWHTRGRRVLYCGPNPATCLLEVLAHAEVDIEDLPAAYQYLEIEAPDDLAVRQIDPGDLPAGWQKQPEATRRFGDEWLSEEKAVLLRVPCVIVPQTWNVLVNPAHPGAAALRVRGIWRHPFDQRLRPAGKTRYK